MTLSQPVWMLLCPPAHFCLFAPTRQQPHSTFGQNILKTPTAVEMKLKTSQNLKGCLEKYIKKNAPRKAQESRKFSVSKEKINIDEAVLQMWRQNQMVSKDLSKSFPKARCQQGPLCLFCSPSLFLFLSLSVCLCVCVCLSLSGWKCWVKTPSPSIAGNIQNSNGRSKRDATGDRNNRRHNVGSSWVKTLDVSRN